jgi:putative lipoprotein (rSAM/lipoprotein system)
MKKFILKPYDKFIIALLTFIGTLTGCDFIHTPAEYGTPYADFEIKGTVTDSISSAPVQHVRVTVTQDHPYTSHDSALIHIDTLAVKETDSAGKYDIQFEDFPLEAQTFKVKAEDVDGSANMGEFAPQQKNASFTQSDLSGGKGWYNGKAVKTIDIKLKKK